MENPRKRYVQQFKKYPDVVSVLTFREMLGGIGDSFARKLIRDGLVKAIFIKPHYTGIGFSQVFWCMIIRKKGAENSFNHCNFLARKYQSYHPITI